MGCYKFENIPISCRVIGKNRFSAAVLNFPDETGSRFFILIYCTDHYYRTWKFAIRISKISQLVLEFLAKYGFSAAILNFPDETGSRFFYLIYFSNHYHRTWKFAFRIFKISQLVLELLAKKRFSAFNLHFPHETGNRFIEPIFFY